MFSDHSAVSCTLQLEKPPLERAEIQYRKLRNINMDSFNEDLRKSNFSSDSELPTIIDQYEKTLEETLRLSAPWYNEEIGKAKRHRKKTRASLASI
jgi:hypothetical protein